MINEALAVGGGLLIFTIITEVYIWHRKIQMWSKTNFNLKEYRLELPYTIHPFQR